MGKEFVPKEPKESLIISSIQITRHYLSITLIINPIIVIFLKPSKQTKAVSNMSGPMKHFKAHASFFIKLLLFTILLSVFIISNFLPQLGQYLEGSTTFSTRIETISEYDAPIMILCVNPGTKPSLSEKYGYHFLPNSVLYDTTEKYKDFDMNLWEMYTELTYKLNEDFEISFDLNRQGNFVELNEGVNYVIGKQINILKIGKFMIIIDSIESTDPPKVLRTTDLFHTL